MTLRRRLDHLEARMPATAVSSDGRRKLADFLDTLANRIEPTDEEREDARRWVVTEWPFHPSRARSR